MGRPSVPLLTPHRIFAAALALIDAKGPASFTVARLAGELGVKSSSLYNHVTTKGDIVEGVRELIVREIDASAFATEPWDKAVLSWARSYRDAFAAHPNTIGLLATTPVSSPHYLANYELVVTGFAEGGWPEEHIVAAITAVESFVLGSAIDMVAPQAMIDPDPTAAPRLTFAVKAQSADADRAETAFELGLRALVHGLRSELTTR